MRRFCAVTWIGTLICAAGLASSASADTVVAKLNSTSPTATMTFTLDSTTYTNIPAGRQNWSRVGGTYPDLQGNFATYCIEILESAFPSNTYTFDVELLEDAPNTLPGGMGPGRADLMEELFGRFFNGLNPSSGQEQGAFQVAIWEIVYDDLDLSTGNFTVVNSGAFYGMAAAMLGALDGTGPRMSLGALVAEGIQDQVFVPEPGSLALLAAGSLLMLRRK